MSPEHYKPERDKYEDKMLPTPENDLGVARDPRSVGPPLEDIGGIERLINRMEDCETTKDFSHLLNDYIRWGNNSKVARNVAIFNMGAAHDCPNRWTDNCQVDGYECYAVVDEKRYPYALDYYRRQEFLWDCLDSQTWSNAFLEIVKRKHSKPTAIKFSQSGDFRHNGDLAKVNAIAENLEKHDIRVFTYSASNYLDWGKYATSRNLTVNQSNSIEDYGDRLYTAVDTMGDIPDGTVHCPRDRQQMNGMSGDGLVECGECTLCIDKEGPDIAVVKK